MNRPVKIIVSYEGIDRRYNVGHIVNREIHCDCRSMGEAIKEMYFQSRVIREEVSSPNGFFTIIEPLREPYTDINKLKLLIQVMKNNITSTNPVDMRQLSLATEVYTRYSLSCEKIPFFREERISVIDEKSGKSCAYGIYCRPEEVYLPDFALPKVGDSVKLNTGDLATILSVPNFYDPEWSARYLVELQSSKEDTKVLHCDIDW